MNFYKKIKENAILALKIAIITSFTLGLGAGINYVLAQSGWAPPTDAPPDGQIAPPLNSGNIGQIKGGGLTLGTNFLLSTDDVLSVPIGQSGFGVEPGAINATLHVKKIDNSPALRLEIPVDTGPSDPIQVGMVLKAADTAGLVKWGLEEGGSGGGGVTSYTTHCSWIVSALDGGSTGNNYPEPPEPGEVIFYRETCQNPDSTGSFPPPACNAGDTDAGVTCYPTGVSIDTMINQEWHPDPDNFPPTWNYTQRQAYIGTCVRSCILP